jgi:hypothetical protein
MRRSRDTGIYKKSRVNRPAFSLYSIGARGFEWRGIGKLAGLRTIRQAPPSSLGVQGTPILLLVNKEGVITSSWRGKLPSEKVLEVMTRV